MLNCNWVIPGGTLETGARFSACDSFALLFEEFSGSGSVHPERTTIHKRRRNEE